ncbi:unnamed protein product [Brassica napus]|nr:unnamed protein product [Brassica napus]
MKRSVSSFCAYPLLPENQKGIKGGSRNKGLRTHHLTSGSRDIWQRYCKKIKDQEEVRKKELF